MTGRSASRAGGGDPDAADRASRLLRGRGQRVTRPRLAVVTALDRLDGHPSAEQVAAEVAATSPGVHRATVYRTLDTLAGLGVVTHVHMSHGTTAYHLVSGESGPHLHARCRVCGRVLDLPPDVLDVTRDRMASEVGFELDTGHVALSGRCADCR